MFTSTVVFSFGKWGWDYWGLTQVQEVVWIIWRDHLRCLSCFSQVTLQWSTALNTHSICLNYTTAPLLSFLKVQNMPVGLMYNLIVTKYITWDYFIWPNTIQVKFEQHLWHKYLICTQICTEPLVVVVERSPPPHTIDFHPSFKKKKSELHRGSYNASEWS